MYLLLTRYLNASHLINGANCVVVLEQLSAQSLFGMDADVFENEPLMGFGQLQFLIDWIVRLSGEYVVTIASSCPIEYDALKVAHDAVPRDGDAFLAALKEAGSLFEASSILPRLKLLCTEVSLRVHLLLLCYWTDFKMVCLRRGGTTKNSDKDMFL